MRIPFWIWLIIGLSLLSWIIPDGIPGEEFILPGIALIGLLLRMRMLRFYQSQFNRYKQQASGAGGPGGGSGGPAGSSAGGGTGFGSQQGTSSFYNRFRQSANSWNTGGAGFGGTGPGTAAERDPYEVLGVGKNASMEDIKKAHRDKLKMFHPDIIASKKLEPEYREFFEEKTREINEAYKQLGGK
jgi:DnaJ-domain-containing protein 1